MRLRLIEGPEGAPNFVYGTEDVETGESVDFVQSDWGYPVLVEKLGGSLPDKDEAGVGGYLVAAADWLESHAGQEFDVPDDAEPIDG